MKTRNTIVVLLVIALFAIGMGYLEGVVVYYIRMILEFLKIAPTGPLPPDILLVEQTREAATIVMLITFAFLIGRSKIEKILIFLYTFAIWDIFYYVSLYILLGWPQSLTTLDVLFLIPSREFWIMPVYVPIFISSATIIATAILMLKRPKKLFKSK